MTNIEARRRAEALFKPKSPPPAAATVFRPPTDRLAKCPVCKDKPADRTNPNWTYRGMACSEECGKAASAALRYLHRSEEWRKEVQKFERQKAKMDGMEAEAVMKASLL